MVWSKQSIFLSMAALALLPLGSCANSPWASQLENSLAADPQLQAKVTQPEISPTASPEISPEISPEVSPTLPANFPAEIPRYPNAELLAVTEAVSSQGATLGSSQPVQTRWQTPDSVAQVQQFYQEKLQASGWQITTGATADQPLRATKDGLEVTIALQRQAEQTELIAGLQIWRYRRESG